MRAVVRVFLTFPTKSIDGSSTYKKLPTGKLFIYVQRSLSQNLRLLGWKIRKLWIIRKIRSVAASRVEHPKQKTNFALISSPCPSCTLARARCLTRDVATEFFFLIIHNSRISHPNNLKFWKKLLCINMSSLKDLNMLKFPRYFLSGKPEKHELRRALTCY